jgi:hypothetical protein
LEFASGATFWRAGAPRSLASDRLLRLANAAESQLPLIGFRSGIDLPPASPSSVSRHVPLLLMLEISHCAKDGGPDDLGQLMVPPVGSMRFFQAIGDV